MLLTLTTTHRPATDLGFLLHKHPDRLQTRELAFGKAHVFYPEASEERCTAALLLEIDPIGLVRKKKGKSDFALRQYVNDRPYVASSFLSAAISRVYGTALNGRSRACPELVTTPIPLTAQLASVPGRGGEEVLHRLFEPLGYIVEAERVELDPRFPDWAASPYFTVTLEATVRLAELLNHLYVLIPVLDDDKHYWVGSAEVDKLLHRGEGWLADHPAREFIARRYLKHQKSLARAALARLIGESTTDDKSGKDDEEEALERPLRLHDERLYHVREALRRTGAARVLDLGCGSGRLIELLVEDDDFREIVGVDVSLAELEKARRRFSDERLPYRRRGRVKLIQGALTYRDRHLEGFHAAAVVEVIEHLDPPRLAAFERALFGAARPGHVVLTTPNVEYNARFEGLPAGRFRHRDHRFEWTRAECRAWAERVAREFRYEVEFEPVGCEDPELGPPSQMAIFRRCDS